MDHEGILDKLLGRRPPEAEAEPPPAVPIGGKPTFDAIHDRIRKQRKKVIAAEGDEHKAKVAHDAALDELEIERKALKALFVEFHAAARDEGIPPEVAT